MKEVFELKRVNKIIDDDLYKEHYARICEFEKTRVYCHHDINHFVDVARIAIILNYRESIGEREDVIYAAAILHDIGRDVQYETGMEHEKASAQIAVDILRRAEYTESEIAIIVEAIREHGNENSVNEANLIGIIYRADKLSRKCYACDVTDTCHKAANKRNMIVKV